MARCLDERVVAAQNLRHRSESVPPPGPHRNNSLLERVCMVSIAANRDSRCELGDDTGDRELPQTHHLATVWLRWKMRRDPSGWYELWESLTKVEEEVA